jgi:hypothetical protein
MLNELVPEQVWVIEDILDPIDLDYVESNYVALQHDMLHVNNMDFKPLMADTNMSYRVVSIPIFFPIFESINSHLNITLPITDSGLGMQYKRFESNDSYDLHAEDHKIYGEYAYILYLTDEEDGAIVLPSKDDHVTSNGFREMQEMFDISFAPETISYNPKKNTCLIMRTGIAHSVESCSGRRDSIAGWPGFIPQTKR